MDKKGIPYFRAVSAVPQYKTLQKKGYKNIYTVSLEYWHDWKNRFEKLDLNYGDFKMALERSDMEMNTPPGWGGVHLCETTISVATYHGTRKLHEEVLVRKTRNSDNKWETDELA